MALSRNALAACTILLAACSGAKSPETGASDGAEASAAPDPVAPEAAMPAEEPTVATSDEPMAQAGEIPVMLRGRWGLVAADCTSTRGDAKGLITVGANSIRFYESVAGLRVADDAAPRRLRGTFAYQGEGMEWTRDLTMVVEDSGKKLAIQEFGEEAPSGVRRYTRCS